MTKIALLACFLVLVTASSALANGKMFSVEGVPPEIPYQRAIILFEDGEQTLILQSKYKNEVTNDAVNSLGWVVPVPAKPEVANMRTQSADNLFAIFDLHTRPRITTRKMIVERVLMTAVGFLMCILIFVLLACLLSLVLPLPYFSQNRRQLLRFLCWSLPSCLLILMLIPALFRARAYGDRGGVEVIDEHSVGIYDVRIVRSDRADELIAWLSDNGFRFGVEDEAAFEDYISRDWCFAVAKVRTEEERDGLAVASEGLPDPLILRFPHKNPVYPIMLTGTGGHETKVLIYLAAETKMTSGGRLTLRYADELGSHVFPYFHMTDPPGFIPHEELSVSYLCKFRDTLSPEEMSEDIYFYPAPDMEPYREHIIRW